MAPCQSQARLRSPHSRIARSFVCNVATSSELLGTRNISCGAWQGQHFNKHPPPGFSSLLSAQAHKRTRYASAAVVVACSVWGLDTEFVFQDDNQLLSLCDFLSPARTISPNSSPAAPLPIQFTSSPRRTNQSANMRQSISRALLIVASAAMFFTSGSTANGITAEEPHHLRKLQTYTASDNYQSAMLQAVNAERAKQGLAPFCTNKKLQAAAQLHSEDQAKNNFMSHTGSNGSQMSTRITAQGFVWSSIAENIAAGQVDVASVMAAWMSSSGHRANILGNYKFFGTGYAYNSGSTYKHYWTQDFGTGANEVCDSDGTVAQTAAPVVTPAPTTAAPATLTPTTPKPTTAAPVTPAPTTPKPTTATPIIQQTTAPATTTATPASGTSMQVQMLNAVNAERAAQGLTPFCTNKKLQAAAQLHSEDQAKNNFMSHTGSNGSQMSTRITAQGFVWTGIAENVAAGQVDVASVVKSWMASEGHRANILGNYKFFGMGYAYNAASTYKYYWTQDFGTGAKETCD